jgi:hypothetical protein
VKSSAEVPIYINNDLEIADPRLYIGGYRNQIQYINRRTLQVLQDIPNAAHHCPAGRSA